METEKLNNYSSIIIIIASRKADIFNIIWDSLKKKVAILSDSEKEKLKQAIIGIIKSLDNQLFLSEKERNKGIIIPDLQVEDIGFNTQIISDKIKRLV